jgi:hypothetical protein
MSCWKRKDKDSSKMPPISLFLPTIMIEARMQSRWHDFGAIKEK